MVGGPDIHADSLHYITYHGYVDPGTMHHD